MRLLAALVLAGTLAFLLSTPAEAGLLAPGGSAEVFSYDVGSAVPGPFKRGGYAVGFDGTNTAGGALEISFLSTLGGPAIGSEIVTLPPSAGLSSVSGGVPFSSEQASSSGFLEIESLAGTFNVTFAEVNLTNDADVTTSPISMASLVTAVPEPPSLPLWIAGLIAVAIAWRRRKGASAIRKPLFS